MRNDWIICAPMCAKLTPQGCRINQSRALAAMRMLDDGVSVFLIDAVDLDRMIRCAQCDISRVAVPEQYVQQVKDAVRKLWIATEKSSWWAGDSEVQSINARARQKRWRDKNKQAAAAYSKRKRLARQIKEMKDGKKRTDV